MKPGIVRPGEETDELLQWLRDHDFDPSDVYQVDITEDTVTVHRYERVQGKTVKRKGVPAVLAPVKVNR